MNAPQDELPVDGFGEALSWSQPRTLPSSTVWTAQPNKPCPPSRLAFPGAIRFLVYTRPFVFWMKPVWTEDLSSLPASKTGEDIAFLIAEREAGDFVFLLSLSNGACRGRLFASDGVNADLRCDPSEKPRGDVFLVARGSSPTATLSEAIANLRSSTSRFRLRTEKPLPAFVDRLGWCTWDAFYRDLTQEKIEAGLTVFKKRARTPGFLIIDDGWQDADSNLGLKSFNADRRRFPQGLAALNRALRSRFPELVSIGLWHTLQGYWTGISPEGELAREYAIETVTGRPEVFAEAGDPFHFEQRHHIDRSQIASFYDRFYQQLSAAGFDLVKVDNQAQLELFTDRPDLPENETRDAYQRALQSAAEARLGGSLIHCMSQSPDIYLSLRSGNVVRNSDDFYPKKDAAAQIFHIIQNAYNSVFARELCLPDWDMFQTYHPQARLHAIARVISGGPIYISDDPQKTDFDLIDRLVVGENTVCRFPQPASLLDEQLLRDPRHADEPLVLLNANHAGAFAVAAFNGVANQTLSLNRSPVQLVRSLAQPYIIHRPTELSLHTIEPNTPLDLSVAPHDAELLSLIPLVDGLACCGLRQKLNGLAAVNAHRVDRKRHVIELTAVAPVLFASERLPVHAALDDREVPVHPLPSQDGFTLELPESAKPGTLEVRFA